MSAKDVHDLSVVSEKIKAIADSLGIARLGLDLESVDPGSVAGARAGRDARTTIHVAQMQLRHLQGEILKSGRTAALPDPRRIRRVPSPRVPR